MKQLSILVLILLFGLKLSAATFPAGANKIWGADSLKTSKNKHKSKSQVVVKHADSLGSTSIITTIPDTSKPLPATGKQDSLKLSAILSHSDSLTRSILTQPDSIKSLNADSVSSKDPAIVTPAPADTQRTLPPVLHLQGAALAISENYKNSPVFYASIDHYDSPRLGLRITYADTVKQKVDLRHPANQKHIRLSSIDSLKQQVRLIPSDSLRGRLYTKIADIYLKYDTIQSEKKRLSYQDHALLYTLNAIHFYSRSNDTLGLRRCFNNLTRVYYDQGKFSEAKWFELQSIAISRDIKDVPSLITSLVMLADIKGQIKDYDLAAKDLDEAIQLCVTFHYPKIELTVLKNYAILYSRMNNYPKEEAMLKKRDSLEKSIEKTEQDSLVAKLVAQNLEQKKKADSVQVKKKVYTSDIKKPYKSSSTKKTDSI